MMNNTITRMSCHFNVGMQTCILLITERKYKSKQRNCAGWCVYGFILKMLEGKKEEKLVGNTLE